MRNSLNVLTDTVKDPAEKKVYMHHKDVHGRDLKSASLSPACDSDSIRTGALTYLDPLGARSLSTSNKITSEI
jgi:hypothetical protein